MCFSLLYLAEAQVEVSFERAPLDGDDLIQHRGQEQSQCYAQRHQQPAGRTALDVKTVVLRFLQLLPDQQRPLQTQHQHLDTPHYIICIFDACVADLSDDDGQSERGGDWRRVPLQRFTLRLSAAAQRPTYTQTQQQVEHLHLRHHVTH